MRILWILLLAGALRADVLTRERPHPPTDTGARAYRVYCAPCHGRSGRGDGPAARYLRPAPGDHTDPNLMNRRTIGELSEIVSRGGPALGLSALMPHWDETLSSREIDQIIKFIQTLYTPITALGAGTGTPEEIILEDDLAVPGLPRRVVVFPGPSRTVLFATPRIAGQLITLGLAFDGAGRVLQARTDPELILKGTKPVSVDSLLTNLKGQRAAALDAPKDLPAELGAAIRSLGILHERALRQGARDAAARKAALAAPATASGQKLFRAACASCHGPTGLGGRVPGPHGHLTSRNLTDGARLNAIPDDDLLFLIKNGGEAARLSAAMPAFGWMLTPAQEREILQYVRSLARPRR